MEFTEEYIFFRSWGQIVPVIDHAHGIYCYDTDGKRYLDGVGGMCVVNIGHGVKDIIDTAKKQMETVSFAHPFQWKNRSHMQLAERIIKWAPSGMSKVFLTSGGSEATETALKMARQYYVERGMPSRYKVISRWNSYHGNTIGSLSMTGMLHRREIFTPLLLDFPHINACNCYHCPFEKEYPGCGILCARELERTIRREGENSIAAFIVEPIVGNAAGALTPPPGYFPIIREICDKYDILLIADEIVTGFGRTGKSFGLDHWGVIPDIICTGKGMSSGYTPIGAVIAHGKVFQVFDQGSKGFSAGFTYAGNPLTCAIASAVLEYIEKHQLIQNVERLSPHFFEKANELAELEVVGEIRGKGFLMGIEFVKDKVTKDPFPPEINAARKISDIAFKNGLVTSPNQGGIDGILGDHILITPPYICAESDLDEIIEIMKETIVEFKNSL